MCWREAYRIPHSRRDQLGVGIQRYDGYTMSMPKHYGYGHGSSSATRILSDHDSQLPRKGTDKILAHAMTLDHHR